MDMKKILQAMDGVSTKPVEGASDMSKFMQIISEGANPHKVSLPVQMAMQHYAEPAKKAVTKESIIGPYFKAVEDGLAEKESEKKDLIKQYASIIAERVMMKESKDDYVPPKEADYGPEYQDMVKRVAAQEKRKQNKQPYRSPSNEGVNNPQDAVTLDIPLMIRLFEYAREDAKTDMDLHDVAERLIRLSSEGRTLTMDDYADICPTQDTEGEM